MSEKLKEVCAYIRVSTDKQEELSPESQIRLIKDYAEQHNMLLTMQSCSGSSLVLPETLMKALIINQSSERNVMLML